MDPTRRSPELSPITVSWPDAWPSEAFASRRVYKRGWDMHYNVAGLLPMICQETDRGCYALVTDLKQRGMLDDTLVIWAGEFGRTVYSQGGLSKENYGRDHHPRCFTTWMTGGGVRTGITYGETDDYSYNVVKDPVHRARLQCDDSALPRHRPQQADVQLPRPGPEADGTSAGQRC